MEMTFAPIILKNGNMFHIYHSMPMPLLLPEEVLLRHLHKSS
jgi:hypothetical protein